MSTFYCVIDSHICWRFWKWEKGSWATRCTLWPAEAWSGSLCCREKVYVSTS